MERGKKLAGKKSAVSTGGKSDTTDETHISFIRETRFIGETLAFADAVERAEDRHFTRGNKYLDKDGNNVLGDPPPVRIASAVVEETGDELELRIRAENPRAELKVIEHQFSPRQRTPQELVKDYSQRSIERFGVEGLGHRYGIDRLLDPGYGGIGFSHVSNEYAKTLVRIAMENDFRADFTRRMKEHMEGYGAWEQRLDAMYRLPIKDMLDAVKSDKALLVSGEHKITSDHAHTIIYRIIDQISKVHKRRKEHVDINPFRLYLEDDTVDWKVMLKLQKALVGTTQEEGVLSRKDKTGAEQLREQFNEFEKLRYEFFFTYTPRFLDLGTGYNQDTIVITVFPALEWRTSRSGKNLFGNAVGNAVAYAVDVEPDSFDRVTKLKAEVKEIEDKVREQLKGKYSMEFEKIPWETRIREMSSYLRGVETPPYLDPAVAHFHGLDNMPGHKIIERDSRFGRDRSYIPALTYFMGKNVVPVKVEAPDFSPLNHVIKEQQLFNIVLLGHTIHHLPHEIKEELQRQLLHYVVPEKANLIVTDYFMLEVDRFDENGKPIKEGRFNTHQRWIAAQCHGNPELYVPMAPEDCVPPITMVKDYIGPITDLDRLKGHAFQIGDVETDFGYAFMAPFDHEKAKETVGFRPKQP